ncbi:MAG: aspartate dehydrogenase domain-containing protein [Pseudomonadota bacterium]
MKQNIKIGVAGCGALGSIVCQSLREGLEGYEFVGISDIDEKDFGMPNLSFAELADQCDWIVECLPPKTVPDLAKEVLSRNKTLLMISACSLLLFPEIKELLATSDGRILVPSGALCGLDAISALNCAGIDNALIATTKPPIGLKGAPYIESENIQLDDITEKTLIFKGNAYDAAQAFPANVNVAATLALAGIGPEKTQVEVWADPNAKGNRHDILVTGGTSTIRTSVENVPDPDNPKSSLLAGYSIVATLKKQTFTVVVV